MMQKIATIIFAIVLMVSCGTTKKAATNTPADEKASIVISYYQTTGYSPTAPEYTIELYSNKQMYLDGKKNLDKTGKYMRVLSDKEFSQLVQAFVDADFFSLKDEYTAEITDLPTRYVFFAYNGQEKKIRDYYGAPENLKALEYSIQSFLDRVGWEKLSW
jgi:hypothetical protein